MAGTYFSRLLRIPTRPDDRHGEWFSSIGVTDVDPTRIPCGSRHTAAGVASAGTAVADVADALTHLTGFTSRPITDTTVGGLQAKAFSDLGRQGTRASQRHHPT